MCNMNRKLNTLRKYVRILFAIVMLHSCAPVYIPNVINTPLLSEKGNVNININTGVSGIDPQVAVAVTDNIGVMLNGSFANRTSDSSANFHQHNFLELAGGYYTKLGDQGRFEAFGGYGMGNIKTEYYNNLWHSFANVNSQRIFVQPAIGATTDMFDGSFATRFVFVYLTQDNIQRNSFFFEPVLTGKIGYKYLKATCQLGLSLPINAPLQFEYQPFIISIGLQGSIGRNWIN